MQMAGEKQNSAITVNLPGYTFELRPAPDMADKLAVDRMRALSQRLAAER